MSDESEGSMIYAFPSGDADRYAPDFGLTKRELFAAMAMQGILGARNGFMIDCGTENVGGFAVKCADNLIAALAKKETSDE